MPSLSPIQPLVLLLLHLLPGTGCADNDDDWYSGNPRREREQRQPETSAGDADLDAHAEADTELQPEIELPERQPGVTPPVLEGCATIDSLEALAPTLRAVGESLWLFHSVPVGNSETLVLHRIAEDGAVGPAPSLLNGARGGDLVATGSGLAALAYRQFYKVLLDGDPTGSHWSQRAGNLAQDGGLYYCSGFEVGRFFEGPGGDKLLALGFDYHDGLFGCRTRVHFSRDAGQGFAPPTLVGNGSVTAAFAVGARLCLVGTGAIWFSDDQGASFTEVEDGDTTRETIRGSGAVRVGERILVSQSYNWANQDHLAVLASDDGGRSWPDRQVLRSANGSISAPAMAAAGVQVILTYEDQTTQGVQAINSVDGGQSWSAPALFSPLSQLPQGVASLAATKNRIALAFEVDAATPGARQVLLCQGRWGQSER